MDMNTVTRLLAAQCTSQSRWEFENFVLEAHGQFKGRAAQAVLARRLAIYELLGQTAASSIRTDLIAEAAQLDQWLASHTEDELAEALGTIEANEEDYWAERLGREAAVDLLAHGRVGKAVMTKAIMLSEDSYRKFAETCGSITNMIISISREVELAQGFATMPEGMPR
jgi:hypothetical protein